MFSALLASTINDELRWREGELALAKVQLQRSIGDIPLFRFSYRSFVAMTYAHFEAYTKQVIAQCIQDILTSGEPWSRCVSSVRENLFAAGLRKVFDSSSNAQLVALGIQTGCIIDAVPAPSLDIILDCSNMNVANFVWAIQSIGLDESLFTFARGDVGHLTSLRHRCAHGEKLTFDASKTDVELARDMYDLQSRILYLMHFLAVEVLDHFAARKYLQM